MAIRPRVDAVPTRESELIAITRDYDTLQTLYRSLLAKKEDSKIAENLEQRQVIEQFKIVDPPHQPERPFSPNRPLIDLGGGVLQASSSPSRSPGCSSFSTRA